MSFEVYCFSFLSSFLFFFFFFFFSSRRRHTRWTGDWSSDVCSSDLLSPSATHLLTRDASHKFKRCGMAALGRRVARALPRGTGHATLGDRGAGDRKSVV